MIVDRGLIENLKILDFKGDVKCYRENHLTPITDNHHNLDYGDVFIVYPGGELNIELPSGKFLRLGSDFKEALFIDHSILDQNYNLDEVSIDVSTLTNLLPIFTPEWELNNNTNYASLINEHDLNFTNHHEDSLIKFDRSSNQDESYSISKIKFSDVISNFDPVNDFFTLPRSGNILNGSNEVMPAQNKVNLDITSHKIDNHGYINFKDSQGIDIPLNNKNLLDIVVDYLQKNLNAKIGDTIIFKIANDSYVYHFHPEIYNEGFGLIKFEGLSFEGMSHIHHELSGNYLYIDFA